MKIKVTQEDIDNGEQVSCVRCPVANALVRQTGLSWGVHGSFMLFCAPGSRCISYVNSPNSVVAFVKEFDMPLGPRNVKPFEFELKVPEE